MAFDAIVGVDSTTGALDALVQSYQDSRMDSKVSVRAAASSAYSDTKDAAARSYTRSFAATDLVSNGSGYLGTNYNFTGFTFNPADTPIGGGSFVSPKGAKTIFTDELIPVDLSRKYLLRMQARQTDPGSAAVIAYAGIQPFDSAGYAIIPRNYEVYANTLTTLAAPLNPGDTTVTLTSAVNWSGAVLGQISLWNYIDPSGKVWGPETYTRNYYPGAFAPAAIAGNVVTLKAPWAGPAAPAGTNLSAGQSNGAAILYGINFIAIPTVWTQYTSPIFGGAHTDNTKTALTAFPPGTAFVKVAFLTNTGQTTTAPSQHAFASVSLSDSTASQARLDTLETTPPVANTARFGVSTTSADNRAALQAALDSLPATNGYLELPEGNLNFTTAVTGVILSLAGKAGICIRGRGRGTTLSFNNVTAVDGLRIDGCPQFNLENVSIRAGAGSKITNMIQYTCPIGGGSHDGIFSGVKISNPSKSYRTLFDVFTTAGSAVITSGSAAFNGTEPGGGMGIAQPTAGVFTSTIVSVVRQVRQLTAAITATQTVIAMNAALVGAPAGLYTVMVDTELMLVTGGGTTANLTVTRGYGSTTAATHASAANVNTYQATLADPAPDTTFFAVAAQVQTPTAGVMVNGMSIGGDHASGSLDIPNTRFFGVDVEGALGAAWKLGGGVAGNILNTTMTGCEAATSTIGVLINGATMSWVSSEVGSNGIDFKVAVPASQPILVKSVRSEQSGLFWEWTGAGRGGGTPVALENISSFAFHNMDGVPVRHQVSASLSIDDCVFIRDTLGLPVSIVASGGTSANPLYYTASSVATSGSNPSPHPAASGGIVRSITPGPQLSGANYLAVPSLYPAVFDSGITTGVGGTAIRPSAATSGAGAAFYDSTLSKPIWSDGAVWKDATGTAV